MIFTHLTLQRLWESGRYISPSRTRPSIKQPLDSIGDAWPSVHLEHQHFISSRGGHLWDTGTRLPSAVQKRADTRRAACGDFSPRAGEPRQIPHRTVGHLGR